jgi:transcription elongation factor Elf1
MKCPLCDSKHVKRTYYHITDDMATETRECKICGTSWERIGDVEVTIDWHDGYETVTYGCSESEALELRRAYEDEYRMKMAEKFTIPMFAG